jgi:hypothetical protein
MSASTRVGALPDAPGVPNRAATPTSSTTAAVSVIPLRWVEACGGGVMSPLAVDGGAVRVGPGIELAPGDWQSVRGMVVQGAVSSMGGQPLTVIVGGAVTLLDTAEIAAPLTLQSGGSMTVAGRVLGTVSALGGLYVPAAGVVLGANATLDAPGPWDVYGTITVTGPWAVAVMRPSAHPVTLHPGSGFVGVPDSTTAAAAGGDNVLDTTAQSLASQDFPVDDPLEYPRGSPVEPRGSQNHPAGSLAARNRGAVIVGDAVDVRVAAGGAVTVADVRWIQWAANAAVTVAVGSALEFRNATVDAIAGRIGGDGGSVVFSSASEGIARVGTGSGSLVLTDSAALHLIAVAAAGLSAVPGAPALATGALAVRGSARVAFAPSLVSLATTSLEISGDGSALEFLSGATAVVTVHYTLAGLGGTAPVRVNGAAVTVDGTIAIAGSGSVSLGAGTSTACAASCRGAAAGTVAVSGGGLIQVAGIFAVLDGAAVSAVSAAGYSGFFSGFGLVWFLLCVVFCFCFASLCLCFFCYSSLFFFSKKMGFFFFFLTSPSPQWANRHRHLRDITFRARCDGAGCARCDRDHGRGDPGR